MFRAFAIFAVVFAPLAVTAVGTPFGQAAGTTGGGSATPATPSSLAELTTWLSDSTARVIVLNKVFDFTSNEGTTTGKACKPWTCSPNPQLAIDANSWCENYESGAATTTVTYNKAGVTPLKVGSNKTILGSGSNAGIKGKGLKISGASNIIIQNIKITDINAQYVWGGDALQIDGGSKIWVDHNYFQHIGRQMVVTGYGAVTKTTFSNNVFNGDGTYSATCNGQHYWVALFTGAGDQITFALNYLYKTSGRGPHVSGTSGYYQNIHIYNNYFVSLDGHAIDPEVGSKVLVEGNYFNSVKTPLLSGDGEAYIPTTSAETASCSSYIGRACVANKLSSSGSISTNKVNAANGFTDSISKAASIKSADDVSTYVQANAGVGIVN
ncbi:polysaccharide lyase family 1 protein [Cylindrobasidium torrendii FP15055 ss-10]|uniref:pectin lyase n=1 Tax=Cylindrobasidium torrendii FP15055 ss-10 TaxID=1314674 RepID=A0A0D7BPL3_9AGAR|nr:polysaccharide lyase family 1 protein [Cylindrobasidium torrendii FP15055 ss-10]